MAAHGHGARPDHLTRTATEPREDFIVPARIVEVRQLTPTVKELELGVEADCDFRFRAGNWVDFFIDQDGVDKVGGYSICSIPRDLPRLRLAVKLSKHPPAAWCHEHAVAGKYVKLKVGGSFFFDPQIHGQTLRNLVLVAGGIGINPLYSMLQEAVMHSARFPDLRCGTLLYSAAVPSEMAYREHLQQLVRDAPWLQLDLRVTRNYGVRARREPWDGAVGRIDAEAVWNAVGRGGGVDGALVYVCGPPSMTDELVAELGPGGRGLPLAQLRFEKWW